MKQVICNQFIRYEEAPKNIIYTRYRHERPMDTITFSSSMPVTALYSVSGDVKSIEKDINIDSVANAVIAYFVLKGENAIDNDGLSRFVKKITGYTISIELTKVIKTLNIKAGFGYSYKSDEISLLNTTNEHTFSNPIN